MAKSYVNKAAVELENLEWRWRKNSHTKTLKGHLFDRRMKGVNLLCGWVWNQEGNQDDWQAMPDDKKRPQCARCLRVHERLVVDASSWDRAMLSPQTARIAKLREELNDLKRNCLLMTFGIFEKGRKVALHEMVEILRAFKSGEIDEARSAESLLCWALGGTPEEIARALRGERDDDE